MTTEEIPAFLKKLNNAKLDPKAMVFVVVGDAKVVRPQLDAVGLPVEDVPAPSAK